MGRLSRLERQALTRRQLLDTARRVFLKRGFHAASLDEVADGAGFSKGAVYSNFTSKDDLFLAVLGQQSEARLSEFTRAVVASRKSRRPVDELIRLEARRWMQQAPEWSVLLIEFWIHAARSPELRRRFAAQHGQLAEHGGRLLSEFAAAHSLDLRLSGEALARAGSAIGHGIALERLVDPDSVSPELVEMMLGSVFRAAVIPVRPALRAVAGAGARASAEPQRSRLRRSSDARRKPLVGRR